jgi:hypothetical protein
VANRIEFAKIATGDQLADALTKQLPGPALLNSATKFLKATMFIEQHN